ncbi:hypothetical protein, partial [Psychroflexus aestuariivivens]|uniref:hypothetical protein n=1 Tax=Psychroflexus aestuariivivens TaxID=1795040 RepID=UPI00195F5A61
MKKVTSVLLLLCSIQFGFGQIISQYVETDSGTSPKGIEIWNNTDATLDFAANNLVVEKGTNGGAPSEDITVDAGTLSPNAVMIIGTIDMETQATNNNVTFVEKSFTFNGDDALVVKYADVITDVFGEPETDPGSNWANNGVSTANQNIQLISGITSGDLDGFTDPSERFETVSSTPSAADGIDGFGLAPQQTTVQVELSITEIFSGQSGSDLTADWFEVKNTGSVAYDASVQGDLYYDDESADATTADLVQDISTLATGEIAIVLVTDNPADVTDFENIWGQVIDLTGVQ